MCTRFHALGFDCDWTAETASRLARLATTSKREVAAAGGVYRVHRSSSGFELWFHFPDRLAGDGRMQPADPSNFGHVAALTPFHAGEGRAEIRVRAAVAFDEENPLEGSYIATLASPGKARQRSIIEMVPFALHPHPEQPITAFAQVVCFAHAVWAHASEADYLSATPKHRLLRPGTFSSVAEDEVRDVTLTYRQSVVSFGLMVGTVSRSVRLVNPITRRPYYWLLLKTRVGVFDVLANPDRIEGDVSAGNLAQVCGSFVGRLEGVTA